MNHRYRIPSTGAIALAACLVLLLHNPAAAESYQWTDKDGNVGFTDSLEKVPPQYRKSAQRMEERGPSRTFQTVPSTPDSGPATSIESPSSEDFYAAWRSRLDTARAELEELKAKRQKAKEEYDISELDQQVRDKEYEITTTIPDEARRAGVPPSVLSH
jgi:hypothetical protein